MKKKIALVFVTLMIVFSTILTGCSSGSGITQADLDAVKAQLAAAQTQLTAAQASLTQAAAEKAGVQTDLQKAQASVTALQKQVTDLQKQINDLKAQYEWVGLTPLQIAEKIIQNYTKTHSYSKTDMFICGDMSSEVWNMLKTQGINAVIVIGNKDAAITDILQSNHAWVLADVGNGQKLALETTGGFVVTQANNPLYYKGWSFSSPTDLKNNNDWINEYNLRVQFRNTLNDEVTRAMNLHNSATNQTDADKFMLLYTTLLGLRTSQETLLTQLKAQIDGLAKKF
jgi:hypothetical protein